MTGQQKMQAILACCAASVIIAISASISYYCVSVDTAAIKAGLIQQRVGSTNIWVEPPSGRLYRAEQ